jgi:ribonuclease HII
MPPARYTKGDSKPEPPRDLFGELACDLLHFEKSARNSGFRFIAGIDEAGRGPLAGPVVAAAVILPEGRVIPGLMDSKQVPEPERERLFEIIQVQAVSFGIGIVDERTIDEVNILQASLLAMEHALAAMKLKPDYLLLDAVSLPRVRLPQKPLVKGDCRSASIAAASILAKVTRDRLMVDLHSRFPQYNFHKHKGYCTKEHLALLHEHGPCEAHRKSFAPVAEVVARGTR